ncbi:hypothetical protein R5R35_008974 [Gryllus longicercus]|uniref:Acyltransferase 3 domain-containing protein n=1 Tax=Gryllus longicercus TaxID=2509291 RepID=A0AAN9VM38_9ORTH
MQCDYIAEGEAPFSTAFSVLKIVTRLPHHLSTITSVVHLGVCLPDVCSNHDIKTLTELVMNNGTLKFGELINIRSPHNPYLFWKDPVFWILVGVSIFIFSMLALGTAYDFYLLQRKEDFAKNNSFECNTGNSNGKINQQSGRITTIQTLDQLCNNNIVKTVHIDNSPSKMEKHCPVLETFHLDMSRLLRGMILSFSVRLNLKTICDRGVGSDTIPIIHGLRFLSMIWVVLGHSCIVAFKYSDNMTYREIMENNFIFQIITNAPYSVDTFFFISGLLVSFLYFRTVTKVDINSVTKTTGFKSGFMQFLGFLGYRYLRLTVPYMFVLGCVQICMKWFQYNSVFEPPTLDHINCPEYWWRNALYINTLFPVQDMCMLWSWYLADDTQFYVLGSILLILATSHFRFAVAITATFLASSWCTTAFVAFSNEHMPSLDDPFALFDKIYDKPWTRLGPYLIGMCVGWYLCKKNCTIRMSKIMAATGWVVSISLLFYLIFGLFKQELHPIIAAIYSSLSHSLWALGLSWIVIACCTGYGGYVNKLLSMSILYPFSRVTYCAYLVHPIIIRVIPMTSDAPLHLTKETVAMLFLGELVASYIVAFVVSLAFEAPMVALLKVINPIRKDEPKKNDIK